MKELIKKINSKDWESIEEVIDRIKKENHSECIKNDDDEEVFLNVFSIEEDYLSVSTFQSDGRVHVVNYYPKNHKIEEYYHKNLRGKI